MHVQDLMTRNPEACVVTDSCVVVGEIMQRRNCGFVPVVDGHMTNRVVGVITDRDLALSLARANRSAERVRVDACMTKPVHTVTPDTRLEDAASLMERYAIHRLPVAQDGQLVGVLSLVDIARATDERLGFPDWREAEQKVTEIVEAIAATR